MLCKRNPECGIFQSLAGWTMRRMSEAIQHDVTWHEETITQNILLQVAKRAQRLTVRAFSKWDEARNGADWEFWFANTLRGKGVAIRFQAKRLYDDSYEGLVHSRPKKNPIKGPTQIEKLWRKRDYSIPAYLFYNHDKFSIGNYASSPFWPGCQKWTKSMWGCSIAPVCAIPFDKSNLNACSNPEPINICPMLPWHILFCGPQSKPLAKLVGDNLEYLYGLCCEDKNKMSMDAASLNFEPIDPPEMYQRLLKAERQEEKESVLRDFDRDNVVIVERCN